MFSSTIIGSFYWSYSFLISSQILKGKSETLSAVLEVGNFDINKWVEILFALIDL